MHRKPTQTSRDQTDASAKAIRRLWRPLFLTRLGLFAERLAGAFWPLWSWSLLIWAGLSFRTFDLLSLELAYFTALTALVGVIGFAVHGFRRFRAPSHGEAVERLDRSLSGRPLTALADQPALGEGDAGTKAVWQAHLQQMVGRVAGARMVAPNLRLSDRDPLALRYVAATAFAMALLFGAGTNRTDLVAALDPNAAAGVVTGPAYEGWIEPPRYTGLPTIYLNEISGDTALAVPVGSRVTLRLYGDTGGVSVEQTVAASPSAPPNENADPGAFAVDRSGTIRISGLPGTAPGWQIDVIEDAAPIIAVTAPVERTPSGETVIVFEASDDYAVTSGVARMTLDMDSVVRRFGQVLPPEPRPVVEFDIPMPFRGNSAAFTDKLVEDLSKHPWSGLPVLLSLEARDDLDQMGVAEPEQIVLPGRRFFDPLAAAIIEQRRDILWNRGNAARVAAVLRAVSHLPDDIFDAPSAYLVLRSAIRRLEAARMRGSAISDAVQDDVAEMLWAAALKIEEGDLADAEARLKRAQERLAEALKNGATEEEVAELLEELRRAMQDYMEKLAQEADRNGDQEQAQNGETREITGDQLQQMLDRIQELFDQGRTEEAMALLRQLQQMMENMQITRQNGQREGDQAMRNLQDTMRQQQQLSDDAFRRLQDEFNNRGENTQPNGTPNQGQQGQPQTGQEGNAPDAEELARRQGALRDLLENQRRGLPEAGTEEGRAAREALRRAEREMGDAQESLNRGDLPDALEQQGDALQALREGLEGLGREMARNQNPNSQDQGNQAGNDATPNDQRDPLGRQAGTTGRLGTEDGLLPTDDLYMRSRELLEEIRRRSGERDRPKIERDYLERLLDRF